MTDFKEMQFDDKIKRAIKIMGYEIATPVQAQVIPLIIAGKNVLSRSHTGSGKTAAFGISLSERVLQKQSRAVLVLCPTRELAVQVRDEITQINRFTGFRAFAVYGGHGIEGEIRSLGGNFTFLCATPGRLLDHIDRGSLDPSIFDTAVLDEADRMLDMGFIDDLKKILSFVRPKHTHLFSATLDGSVAKIIHEYIPEYEQVIIQDEIIGKDILEQEIRVTSRDKFYALADLLRDISRDRVLIFVSTKRYADTLARKLIHLGFNVACIHGDKTQNRREIALNQFRTGRKDILIATDVAARGLQIDDVGYVINYDVANDSITHKHRIGRTGRMGKTGRAITFVVEEARFKQRYNNRYNAALSDDCYK